MGFKNSSPDMRFEEEKAFQDSVVGVYHHDADDIASDLSVIQIFPHHSKDTHYFESLCTKSWHTSCDCLPCALAPYFTFLSANYLPKVGR